jgi:hypothetical protein
MLCFLANLLQKDIINRASNRIMIRMLCFCNHLSNLIQKGHNIPGVGNSPLFLDESPFRQIRQMFELSTARETRNYAFAKQRVKIQGDGANARLAPDVALKL